MIGEDWKGFNAACYKKNKTAGNNGWPEVGLNYDSESDSHSNCEIRSTGWQSQRVDLIRRSIASPLRASTMRRR